MRTSSFLSQQQSINAIIDGQASLAKTQLQITTGKRVITPSDDPIAARSILNINQQITQAEQFEKNGYFARSRLELQDTTLSAVNDVVFRVRELMIQGANNILPDVSRQAIAEEIKLKLSELVGLGNTRDGSGEYIFSGFQGNIQAFSKNSSGNIVYNGDQGQRYSQISSSIQVAVGDSGHDVFQFIRQGNGVFNTSANLGNTGTGVINPGSVVDPSSYVEDTYTLSFALNGVTGLLEYTVTGDTSGVVIAATPYVDGGSVNFNGVRVVIEGTPDPGDTFTLEPSIGQSLFTTIENSINAIETSGDTSRINQINQVLTNLDQSINHLSNISAKVGARLNTTDAVIEQNQSFLLSAHSNLSGLQDLDFAQAVSDMSTKSLALEAAQKSFVKVSNLFLFNFL